MKVINVTPTLGSEVSGIDLSKPLDAAVIQELRQIWLERKVLVFREQSLTRDQH